ncbi:MAG: hypothetical protein M3137_15340 [Actinomycetota bacterium]|nr:hypothetical protein [Actinomycetota bacterium]
MATVALVVLVAFVGVGVALVVAAGVLGLGVALVGASAGGVGPGALQAPGVVMALGAELIAAAVLVGWRVGGRITVEEDDGHGPVVG